MRLSRFSLHFVSALAVATSALASPPVLHPGHSVIPPGWSLHRRAELNATIPLKIALKQSNVENLESYLMDVADPASPNYGKYWTRQKVIEVFRPSSESVNVVQSWLVDDHSIDPAKLRLGHDGGVLHLDVTVAEAEETFAAEYYVFRHTDGTERVGTHQPYHLPEHVAKHVDLVLPALRLGGAPRPSGIAPMPMPTSDNGTVLINHDTSQCDAAVTLECLRELYNFNYTLVSRDKNSIAVEEYEGQSYKGSDLDLFFQTFSPNQVGRRPTLVSISGGQLNETSNDKDVLEESDMDLQLIMGLLPLQDVLLYQDQRSSPRIGDDDTLGALDAEYCKKAPGHLKDCGNKPSAHVVSISYGDPDIYDFDLTPPLVRQCPEIGKLTLAGMTFVASSGDAGVAWGKPSDSYCVVNGTFKGGSPQTGYFVPTFPASCPFVTAVGATQVADGRTVRDPETASTGFPSGGGFSSNFVRQPWQDAQVADYLSKHDPKYAPAVFERTGRVYPDVAANGCPIVGAVAGQLTLLAGTSASAPIVASLIAAVNDARIARGKGPVGFINPALYSDQFKGVFNDITIGSNPGCGTPGFQAAPGWDPVTGLGTLNFERLLEQFLALP